jgi:hypothetical protein
LIFKYLYSDIYKPPTLEAHQKLASKDLTQPQNLQKLRKFNKKESYFGIFFKKNMFNPTMSPPSPREKEMEMREWNLNSLDQINSILLQ